MESFESHVDELFSFVELQCLYERLTKLCDIHHAILGYLIDACFSIRPSGAKIKLLLMEDIYVGHTGPYEMTMSFVMGSLDVARQVAILYIIWIKNMNSIHPQLTQPEHEKHYDNSTFNVLSGALNNFFPLSLKNIYSNTHEFWSSTRRNVE
ncbi:CLUMA_CG016648, isoform A [Clunio marinus]|uniref:CLUMA_CG016648, isoform A n=1 Tax=Clunio marinus TaxID=568069 RepID=A0A1J1IU72_9DIPT|nr:CLUMA_CG016648, isoform A [Clunio marinus]